VTLVRFALTLSLIGGVAASAVASPADGILSGYSLTSWNDGAGARVPYHLQLANGSVREPDFIYVE